MEITTYQPDPLMAELTEFLREKYGSHKDFDYFLNETQKALSFCTGNENVSFYPIAGFENGKMRAHIALIIDKRLPAGEAFFGFLECPKDAATFDLLWSGLLKESRKRGVSVLKGPVNGSIWHQYRCIKETDNSAFFKTELFSESYYYDFLVAKTPTTEIQYCSASRESFDVILHMIGENWYNRLAGLGFSMKETRQVTHKQLLALAHISKVVFKNSWGYTELTESEFMQLYSSEKLVEYLSTLYLLYKGDEIIGFCSTSQEDIRTLVCKTIALLPQYQGMGLGNAFAYKIHLDAKKEGFEKMIYALIREGNNIKNFPKDDVVIFRRYAAFDFHL